MFQNIRRVFLTLLFLSLSTPYLLAADAETEGDEPVLDVMGTVSDHDYLKVPGGKIYLPRLIVWEDAGGATRFDAALNTKTLIKKGNFVEADLVAVPADGGSIIIDFSITSHLIYFWLGMILAVWLTISMSRRYKKGVGREVEPKGALQNIFEVLFVFIRDDVARSNIDHGKADKYVPYFFT
ncbi:MAG: F0F1 ATP synthase subunit A, partial [Balneolales bacterium]|nr:F0F1 ATP synthase subunit A [Balneolales bacterium]